MNGKFGGRGIRYREAEVCESLEWEDEEEGKEQEVGSYASYEVPSRLELAVLSARDGKCNESSLHAPSFCEHFIPPKRGIYVPI